MAKKDLVKAEEHLPSKFDYGDDQGAGYDNQTQEDKALPWLALLQDLSPQVKKGEGHIEGAEPGMFCNTLTRELFPEGVEVVFATTEHVFCEYKPDRGGFIGRRGIDDAEVVEARRTQEFGKYHTTEGNDLIETFYYYGVFTENCMPFIMGITSTKIKHYKQFNSRLDMYRTPDRGQKPPMYAHRIFLTAFTERKKNNDFFNIRIRGAVEDDLDKGLLEPSDPRFIAAKTLYNVVQRGEAKVDYEAQQSDDNKVSEDVF